MFRGVYRGKTLHADDFELVLERAAHAGVERMIVTAGTLEESRAALELAEGRPQLFSTVGVHPTRCGVFAEADRVDARIAELLEVARRGARAGTVVAVGECGLDYDRLQFCDREAQQRGFEAQFALAEATGLPMFLHMRAACDDFCDILERNLHRVKGGAGATVVHSFDGSPPELERVLSLGCLVGINGCSLKTRANLDAAASVPLDRLVLETDGPWCDIRATHAGHGFVRSRWATRPAKRHDGGRVGECAKNRTEPCHLRQVLEVVAGARGEDPAAVAEQVLANTMRVFFRSAAPG
jgi:TatD DNase family protein